MKNISRKVENINRDGDRDMKLTQELIDFVLLLYTNLIIWSFVITVTLAASGIAPELSTFFGTFCFIMTTIGAVVMVVGCTGMLGYMLIKSGYDLIKGCCR